MIKIVIFFTSWLGSTVNRVDSWLKNRNHSTEMNSKFVDLAPTDNADKTGVYSEAILWATENAKICNIALTGPYGSGKSSIIQSFLKKYEGQTLQISLATFGSGTKGDEDNDGGRQAIERSILQQMLYGADANKLPLSRFKRIQSPAFGSSLKSLFIMLGTLSILYTFHQRENIIDGIFFLPLAVSNWINLGSFVLAIASLWITLHHFYVASFGLSLKGISLKDVEIRPAFDDQTSILNRHLDELVYFFQSTDYDLVIIEDLDRFNNTDIFITLREINRIVNENAGVKRTIRFLYALRDDLFVSTDRTKFFEFIVPVVPIINSSNSIDMVLAQGRRLKLEGRFDRQFLREVSRYLNDLRLIQNIFNEYAIYIENLETNGESLLDANKLLAVLIYKNVYPKDFEQLHRGEGKFASILYSKERLVLDCETQLRAEISDLEHAIEVAQRQTPSDLRELRQIYVMNFIEILPANVVKIGFNSGSAQTSFSQLVDENIFDNIFSSAQVNLLYGNGARNMFNVSTAQDIVSSQESYLKRKKEIESKTIDNRDKKLRQISILKSKLVRLRTARLNELFRLNAHSNEELFDGFGDNGELARFLILEGHLDDTYYQYISLFHSGRLSPNDNKFLIQIRAFITPEPGFILDNPKEVIAAMRDEDFRQSYVLNVKLVDSLLRDKDLYHDQSTKLFEFLSSEFESAENFFDAYYTSGSDVEALLVGLTRIWEGFVPAAIASQSNTSHITQLVSNLPESMLKVLARNFEELPEFVSANLPEILEGSPELAPERLVTLNFEVKDLAAIKEHPESVRLMFEQGLFQLSIDNLEYICQALLGVVNLEPLRERNYSFLRSTNNAILINRIKKDFNFYLRDILLGLEGNSKEDATAMLSLIQNDMLDIDSLRVFLERQTNLLPSAENVPNKFHAMLYELNIIEATWLNCLTFINSEEFEPDILVAYLAQDEVRDTILKLPISGASNYKELRSFLFNADQLSDVAYREYVHALPNSFMNFPKALQESKIRILIDERKVSFTKESLYALNDNRECQVQFVVANIDSYLADPETFSLDDDFKEEILRSEIEYASKLALIELMNLGELVNLPERSAIIGSIVDSADVEISELDGSIAKSLIIHSKPIETQISLFNKYHKLMTDDEVRYVLDNLPEPYSDIKTGHNIPKLKSTPKNKSFVRWLKTRKFISSWSDSENLGEDIKVHLYRPK